MRILGERKLSQMEIRGAFLCIGGEKRIPIITPIINKTNRDCGLGA